MQVQPFHHLLNGVLGKHRDFTYRKGRGPEEIGVNKLLLNIFIKHNVFKHSCALTQHKVMSMITQFQCLCL